MDYSFLPFNSTYYYQCLLRNQNICHDLAAANLISGIGASDKSGKTGGSCVGVDNWERKSVK